MGFCVGFRVKLKTQKPYRPYRPASHEALLAICAAHLRRVSGRHTQVVAAEGVIYMVLEYGDIDLAHMLAKQEAARRAAGDTDPDENFIRLYWQQMLQVGAPYDCRI